MSCEIVEESPKSLYFQETILIDRIGATYGWLPPPRLSLFDLLFGASSEYLLFHLRPRHLLGTIAFMLIPFIPGYLYALLIPHGHILLHLSFFLFLDFSFLG